jgi:hypothetical protein
MILATVVKSFITLTTVIMIVKLIYYKPLANPIKNFTTVNGAIG